jgi:hypothetical protein
MWRAFGPHCLSAASLRPARNMPLASLNRNGVWPRDHPTGPPAKPLHRYILFIRLCTKPKLGLTPFEIGIGVGVESNRGTKLHQAISISISISIRCCFRQLLILLALGFVHNPNTLSNRVPNRLHGRGGPVGWSRATSAMRFSED